ncbi:hypothetical protein [Streptomyces sp. NPDC096339]|uniref:hypothetical protein n=1 Tax=Streptomyces sp. NPDC096339 TaxID=3366086 RepID=UPI003820ABE2
MRLPGPDEPARPNNTPARGDPVARYLITHPKGQQGEDILVEDPDLTLTIQGEWAILADSHKPCLALPAHAGATITRIDDEPEE